MKIRKALYPFSLLYGLVTSLRNKLFDWQVLESKQYDFPVISVGNITVGGTGKTPLTEYLIRLLKHDYKVSLLSRGYKRKTKGALLANEQSTASDIGDEPFQVGKKNPMINVVVAEKRVEGMSLINNNTNTDVVLMDDAYQHRYVKPGFSILVIDYNRPLWSDLPFPAGDMRETRAGQKRANIILVNKCPENISNEEKQNWVKRLKLKSEQNVFFSCIKYGEAKMLWNNENVSFNKETSIVGLAGIAQPDAFFSHLDEKFSLKQTLAFGDHHNFTEHDLSNIHLELSKHGANTMLITTEKDTTRLDKTLEFYRHIAYVPIELSILFEEEKTLENLIRNYVRNNQKDS
ncbi:tetraacyldisaccharide 4'-kinase [Carboxylicivirga sp. N1Y90]|uniref:tetraacyldisaccharide 4'-kinase n=1 Tax=Carboxylicivirga fragile TaxID=3417571 RepID=UPI003D34E10A|nr:tetraacyldisaccharide 4'-kinase [Marinilabiliaceae bacterium N1Y90]